MPTRAGSAVGSRSTARGRPDAPTPLIAPTEVQHQHVRVSERVHHVAARWMTHSLCCSRGLRPGSALAIALLLPTLRSWAIATCFNFPVDPTASATEDACP